jgi:hypothetical protein
MGWVGGLAQWKEGEILYLSVAFTYKLNEAYQHAAAARFLGLRVIAGGPGIALMLKHKMVHPLMMVAELGDSYPDVIAKHNPDATFASRGCTEKCSFCIVPFMNPEGLTVRPDFPVRPVLCDNNLSALPADYQDYIIDRYVKEGIRLKDANSGFEPKTFTEEVYTRWKPLINAGGGPWRFGYDHSDEAPQVREVFKMLKNEPSNRKRPYVLIGNEPFDVCMERIYEAIGAGCEPHVQPFIALNALTREPRARFDWTTQKLKDVARWANAWLWRKYKFEEYDRKAKKSRIPEEKYDEQQGLFI